MGRLHRYSVATTWTGNLGQGTINYRDYSRDHESRSPTAAYPIQGSSDPHFRGDGARHNPEQLLVASLSSCHLLWVLHLCAEAGIVVTGYSDNASGTMSENEDGSGQFTEVTLRPRVVLAEPSRSGDLDAIHHQAHELCFIARSVNFPVVVEPQTD